MVHEIRGSNFWDTLYYIQTICWLDFTGHCFRRTRITLNLIHLLSMVSNICIHASAILALPILWSWLYFILKLQALPEMQKEAKPQKQQLLWGVSANFFGEAASMHIFFRQGRLTKVCFQKGWTDKKQNIPDLPKTGGRVYCWSGV